MELHAVLSMSQSGTNFVALIRIRSKELMPFFKWGDQVCTHAKLFQKQTW